jgi:hypothetical protein
VIFAPAVVDNAITNDTASNDMKINPKQNARTGGAAIDSANSSSITRLGSHIGA